MRRIDPTLRRLPLLGLLLLAGCESDTAELIQEINAAREGCTEEKLKAGAEECVRMMERYAEMGTEAMEGYIGAVKSLDQALRRMPPPQFDTAGLGHALTPSGGAAAAWGDTTAARGLYPTAPGLSRRGDGRSPSTGWSAPAYPRDPWSGRDPGYGEDPRYDDDPRYGEEGWYGQDPRYADPAPYGERYPVDPYSRGGYDPRYPEEAYGDPRAPGQRRGADDRRDEAPYPDRYGREERWRDGRPVEPRATPQPRGRLLPPEQRLRRPWLEEERPRQPGSRRAPRAEWPDTVGGL